MKNAIVTTVEESQAGGWNVYDANRNLAATVCPQAMDKNNRHRICWYGGMMHGKVSYANDWQEMNDTVSAVVINGMHV